MSNAVAINPALLTWARERAGVEAFMLEDRFPKLTAWEAGETQPTLAQLEKFAHAVHVPIGYLFLPAPVQETLPSPIFVPCLTMLLCTQALTCWMCCTSVSKGRIGIATMPV